MIYCPNNRENMKAYTLFLPLFLLMGYTAVAAPAAKCSRANLTRCLDSACALNISSNPAARCQYCGTASAGTPNTKNAMRAVSAGASAKYNISDKDLKKAPTDPGERYAWATEQCIAKVTGCTPDDVTETYDKLIEQSCTAAGISAKMEKLQKQAAKSRTKTDCSNEISACIIADNACTADYRNCEANADFDKFFSTCGVQSTGCDNFISDIRTELIAERDSAIKNADTILAKIIATYQNARETKLANTRSDCEENKAFEQCVETVCNSNMPDKCADNTEKVSAGLLCQFYKTACKTLR